MSSSLLGACRKVAGSVDNLGQGLDSGPGHGRQGLTPGQDQDQGQGQGLDSLAEFSEMVPPLSTRNLIVPIVRKTPNISTHTETTTSTTLSPAAAATSSSFSFVEMDPHLDLHGVTQGGLLFWAMKPTMTPSSVGGLAVSENDAGTSNSTIHRCGVLRSVRGNRNSNSSLGSGNGHGSSGQSLHPSLHPTMLHRRMLGVSTAFVGVSNRNHPHSNHTHPPILWQLSPFRSYELELQCFVLPLTAASSMGTSGGGEGGGSRVVGMESVLGKYEVTIVIAKLATTTNNDEMDGNGDEDDDEGEGEGEGGNINSRNNHRNVRGSDSDSGNFQDISGNVVVYRDQLPAVTTTAASQYQRPGLESGPIHTRVPSDNLQRQQQLFEDDSVKGKAFSCTIVDSSGSVTINGMTRFTVNTTSSPSLPSLSLSSDQQDDHSVCNPSLHSFFITFLDEGHFSIQTFSRDIRTSMSSKNVITTTDPSAWHLSSEVMVAISLS